MKITFMGTGGSVPVSNPKRVLFGGNTTCVRVESKCIPQGSALVIDGGSGFVPLAPLLLKEGVKELNMIFTHYHHDHTQGIPLAATTFVPAVKNVLWGGVEREVGPREVLETLMQPPFFPKDFNDRSIGSHFVFRDFKNPSATVIVVHPLGGFKRLPASDLEKAESNGKMLTFGDEKFDVRETLVIRMVKSNHPEFTISYRFEERPTGKVFVFLTDHENTDGLPTDLKNHMSKADFLVMDSQYKRATYDIRTAGFGHGTPDYCVRMAHLVGARKLGLTHHDPSSTDDDIAAILHEAQQALVSLLSGGVEGAILKENGNPFVVAIHDYESFDL